MFDLVIPNIIKELQKVGDALKEEMRRDGHYATGKTEKSIHVVHENNNISLKSNPAPKYLTEGSEKVRNGSGGVLYNAIYAWVKAKGVTPSGMTNESFAWAIYNKRVKHGYSVPNAFNDGETVGRIVDLEAIMKRIETVVGKNIAEYVETNINI